MCVLNVSKLFPSRVLVVYIKLKVKVNVEAKVVLNVDHDLCLLTYDDDDYDDDFKGNMMRMSIRKRDSERDAEMCVYFFTG